MILCRDICLLVVILYRDSNLSSSELHLVRVLLLLLFLFVAFVGSLVLVSNLFGLCLGKSLTTVCLAFVGALGVTVGVESRFFGMGLLVV